MLFRSDTYVARLARQTKRVLAADPIDCAALGTLEHALALTLEAARAASRSVTAELPLLPELDELLDLALELDLNRDTDRDLVLYPEHDLDPERDLDLLNSPSSLSAIYCLIHQTKISEKKSELG